MVTFEQLLKIVKRVSLLTDEGDDKMHGVYIDHNFVHGGTVRAKGSTLALIEDARQALKDAGVED